MMNLMSPPKYALHFVFFKRVCPINSTSLRFSSVQPRPLGHETVPQFILLLPELWLPAVGEKRKLKKKNTTLAEIRTLTAMCMEFLQQVFCSSILRPSEKTGWLIATARYSFAKACVRRPNIAVCSACCWWGRTETLHSTLCNHKTCHKPILPYSWQFSNTNTNNTNNRNGWKLSTLEPY